MYVVSALSIFDVGSELVLLVKFQGEAGRSGNDGAPGERGAPGAPGPAGIAGPSGDAGPEVSHQVLETLQGINLEFSS